MKQLRTLSDGSRKAVAAAVTGYTLQLGGSTRDPKLAAFLNSSQLLCLKLIVPSLGEATGEQILFNQQK